MIDDLDRSLEQLLQLEFGTTLPFDVSFAIPDKNFAPVSKTKSTLSCYLYEINEDRELRDVAPMVGRTSNGMVSKVFPPARVRLSYLITAWSPAQAAPGVEPEFDEHNLLSRVLQVLYRYPTLPTSVLVGTLRGQDLLPTTRVILPDTSKATSDFWTAIGGQLRPSLDYKVTFALPYQADEVVTPATALKLGLANEQPFYTISGTVRNAKHPTSTLASAWVRVNELERITVTNATGDFLLERLVTGTYTLTVRAVGFQEGKRIVRIPAAPADGFLYDVLLTPL